MLTASDTNMGIYRYQYDGVETTLYTGFGRDQDDVYYSYRVTDPDGVAQVKVTIMYNNKGGYGRSKVVYEMKSGEKTMEWTDGYRLHEDDVFAKMGRFARLALLKELLRDEIKQFTRLALAAWYDGVVDVLADWINDV